MKKILYSKYNSLRMPEFQTETRIIEEDGLRYVDKRAIRPIGQAHIEKINQNYEKVSKLYDGKLKVAECTKMVDGVRFDYIKGQSLLEGIDFEQDSLEEITGVLKRQLRAILPEEKLIREFVMSESFSSMFPGCSPDQEPAFPTANMDSIFSNFIFDGTDVWCIDYEWVFDFDIPVDFVKYRGILYVYKENRTYLEPRIPLADFLRQCGISEDKLPLYEKMEYCFQQYVHGKDVKYIYTEKYKKPVETEKQLRQTIRDKETHIQNLTALMDGLNEHVKDQDAYIEKVRKAMKNPFYAASLVAKKAVGKLRRTSESESGE